MTITVPNNSNFRKGDPVFVYVNMENRQMRIMDPDELNEDTLDGITEQKEVLGDKLRAGEENYDCSLGALGPFGEGGQSVEVIIDGFVVSGYIV
jgi:hypothetical protein